MEMIKHRIFGVGEVVSREVKGKDIYIVASFKGDRELKFKVPDSFESGVIEAEGSLKEEVDNLIRAKQETDAAAIREVLASLDSSLADRSSTRRGRTAMALPTGKIAEDYEDYLTRAGYSLETDSGNPSTVYAYAKAVESVLDEEGLTWNGLKDNIATIVKKYDVGGEKEAFGCKSNKTVINALRRFEEFAGAL